MGRLDDRVTIITGAARGIGEAAARRFVAEGARVVLVDTRERELDDLVRELGPRASARVADVCDESAVSRLTADAIALHGRVDIALLNAGIGGEPLPLERIPTEMFDKLMAVNVRGVFLGLKYLMPAMTDRGGSIVIMASTSGVRAIPNMAAYVTSKHAVNGLMKAAALEGAPKGIRVNSVNPATIDTPMVSELVAAAVNGRASPASQPQGIPLGRRGTAVEVANLMLYLASDESSFCTGGVYMVDGGVTAGRG